MEKQLFFVDDDVTMIRLFSLIAQKNNWIFDTAVNHQELDLKLKENSYKVIFMDIELDDIDSLPFINEIKKINPKTKVIMVSGHTLAEYFTKVKEAGADDYLPKPIKIDDFIQKVKEYLQ